MLSGGNFHAQPIALAADLLAAAVADLSSISERRVENLVNPDLSGLPGFLTPHPGLNSGMMLVQVLAAALVSENKAMSFPASVDSIPTSANREDHVSMATAAARKARTVVTNATRVLACEVLCAAQGLEFHRPLKAGKGAEAAYQHVRAARSPAGPRPHAAPRSGGGGTADSLGESAGGGGGGVRDAGTDESHPACYRPAITAARSTCWACCQASTWPMGSQKRAATTLTGCRSASFVT